jgi:hypothetical protein
MGTRDKPGMVPTHGALWRLMAVAAVISGVILTLALWRC